MRVRYHPPDVDEHRPTTPGPSHPGGRPGVSPPWTQSPDRFFGPDPAQRETARRLYASVAGEPLVCPHTHLDATVLADPDATLGTPAELFVMRDHYVSRLLHSQGIGLEQLGIPTRDGTPVETDHRRIWQLFAEHFHLFQGTPTGLWLTDELIRLFGVEEKLTAEARRGCTTTWSNGWPRTNRTPRALLDRGRVEVVCTTDAAGDDLAAHRALDGGGWAGRVRPTFRPDAVTDAAAPRWRSGVADLAAASGIDIVDYSSFIAALESRRSAFAGLGAVATDTSVVSPHAERLMVKLLLDNYQGPKLIPQMRDCAYKAAEKGNQWYVMEFLTAYEHPGEDLFFQLFQADP